MIKDRKNDKEIKIRISTANAAMTNLETISKRRSISLHTKKHIYKLVKLSILLYGCKFWTISKNLEVLRIGFETKASGKFWGEIQLHKKEHQ